VPLTITPGDDIDRDAGWFCKRCVTGMIVGVREDSLSNARGRLTDSSEVGFPGSCPHSDGLDISAESAAAFRVGVPTTTSGIASRMAD